MRDHDRMCLGCMGDLPEGADVCPNCGWGKESQNEAHALRAGSVLAGKYLVGRELGQGSFGITYLAWDLPGNRRVAVKEYYPLSLAVRHQDRYTVSPVTDIEVFARGRNKFLNGAKNLAQFAGLPGIVSARDFFEENGTAYLVMEYLEGRTLREELNSRSQPMTVEEALNILTPVAEALEAVHASGLIHRDISPENILLTPGGAKLLDFGTGRAFSLQTDVYALAATVYRCVTGREPEPFYERVPEDRLTPPGSLNPSVTPEQERVILTGMAMDYRNRYQTVRELMEALKNPLSAPWYDTKTDKFVDGDAKTVSIEEFPPIRLVYGPPPAPEPIPRWKPVLAIVLSVLGIGAAIIGLIGGITMGIGDYTTYDWSPGTYAVYLLLQLGAMACMYPILRAAVTQIKDFRVQPCGRKPILLCFALCVLIPVAILLGIMTSSSSDDCFIVTLFVGIFALLQFLADTLVFGPFWKRR